MPEQQINEQTKRLLIKNFFSYNVAKFPSFWDYNIIITYISVALGIFILFYFRFSIVTILLATASIANGFYFAIRWVEPYYQQRKQFSFRPTAEQMEYWLVEDIRNAFY